MSQHWGVSKGDYFHFRPINFYAIILLLKYKNNMDEQPQITPIVPEAPKKSVLFPVLLAIFLTVAVSGGGMYYWLNQLMDQSIAGLQGHFPRKSSMRRSEP
jgi:hypothetical protein